MIYRNTDINWLIEFLEHGIKKKDDFISLSSHENSGNMDNFGDTKIIFNKDLLDNQGLEEVFYEEDYFNENPKISKYITGFENEEDFYDDKDYDNSEEAYDQCEMDWESNIKSYEHEEEFLMSVIRYEEDLIEKVILQEHNIKAESLLNKYNIEYEIKKNINESIIKNKTSKKNSSSIYYNVLRFEEFVHESTDLFQNKLNLTENIKTNTNDVLDSIDIEKVDLHKTLNLLVKDINLENMTIKELSNNTSFVKALDSLFLKKEEPTFSSENETFLTSSLTFMGIYPIQVLEIQDPEYLLIQIENHPISLYKVSGSIKSFYDKLTIKTIEITSGDQKWIYKTSNSGNNWDLLNDNEGSIFKNVMTTQELEDSLNSNTKIEII